MLTPLRVRAGACCAKVMHLLCPVADTFLTERLRRGCPVQRLMKTCKETMGYRARLGVASQEDLYLGGHPE